MEKILNSRNEKASDVLKNLAFAGMMEKYGENSFIRGLHLWELRCIQKFDFVGHYLLAYQIFKRYADSAGIEVWARGAVPSSLLCYSLGLTKIEPLDYGLHHSRFVNDETPKFQFDVESKRFDEFMEGAERILAANVDDFDTDVIRGSLLHDVVRMDYLTKKHPRPVPDDIDDELARYALKFPDTMDLYDCYLRRKNGEPWQKTGFAPLDRILAPTCGILAYQEQMFDIIRALLSNHGLRTNKIRKIIQRGDNEEIAACKALLFQPGAFVINMADAEIAWQVLTSNRRAFLKAHAVSRVVAKYNYEF